jgi:hypothetical protein
VYVPSLETRACFISIASRATRTWSNRRNPLSTALYPILGPMSPAVTPGMVSWFAFDRICTTNACGPLSASSPRSVTNSRAITIACVAVLPIPPGHHFVEVKVGE